MAKRKEVILQEVLNTQEVWDDAMSKPKLYVVDAHQKWCGPCTAIIGMLKRIKNELGDDLLRFATAEVDSIDSLEQYRGKCEPNFLFFGGGELVAAVRGCNAPLIQHTITQTLETEHLVVNGEAQRKVIRDSYTGSPDHEEEPEAEAAKEEEGEEGVVPKQVTVALIKPDVVQNGQVDEIIEKIKEAGIEILVNDEHLLTEEEAAEFYKAKAEESYFDDLIKYVTSGPCRVLVLTKGNTGQGVVQLWRDIIGPFDAAVAKDESPQSLRSIYGENATKNALHGSSSEEEAVRELGFFYPNFRPPPNTHSSRPGSRAASAHKIKPASAASAKDHLQRTLAIIRPDALRQHREAIMQKIAEAGFEIAMQKEVTLTTEQAEEFYQEHKGQDYFDPLVKQMTCGPVLALCLAHTDAVNRWREMLGPKIVSEAIETQPDSLRAQFGEVNSEINMLHGSDTTDNAESELAKIFKVEQTLAVIKPDAIDEKEQIIEKLKEAGFMISCQKDMSLSKEIASEIYKSKEGAEFYDDLIGHMTSGNTMMMVLSAENAVDKLKELTGPTDPEEAKKTNPNSLRALFAKSTLENAIHSPSSKDSANEQIRMVFGDTPFEWDGSPSSEHLNVEAPGEDEKSTEEENKKEDEDAAGAESQEAAAEGEKADEEEEKHEEDDHKEDAKLDNSDESGKEESDRESTSSSSRERSFEATGEGQRESTDETKELTESDPPLDTETGSISSKPDSRPTSKAEDPEALKTEDSDAPKPPSPREKTPPRSRSGSSSSSDSNKRSDKASLLEQSRDSPPKHQEPKENDDA